MSMLRTFVAVELSSDVRRSAGRLIGELSHTDAKIKWVAPENLHLTLTFLGDVDERQIPQLCQSVDESIEGREMFDIRCAGLGAFPNTRRPTTIWIGVQQGEQELCSLQAAIADALASENFPKETRRYHPHLTLGRVRRGGRSRQLAELLRQHESYDAGASPVAEVVVMSSDLQPTGPVYQALARIKLT